MAILLGIFLFAAYWTHYLSVNSARYCHVCQEYVALGTPLTCKRTMKADCNRMLVRTQGYTDEQIDEDVFCMTRTTKDPSTGETYVEKTCVTEKLLKAASHPSTAGGADEEEVGVNNCGSYRDENKKYCVCSRNYCNAGQLKHTDMRRSSSALPPVSSTSMIPALTSLILALLVTLIILIFI